MYAILSPRVLVQDLKIDRERAERLLALLEERGAVGPTFITGTGARESRVNITQDEAPATPESLFVGTDADLGRRTLLVAVVCALVGLALELALYWVGAGAAVSRWLRAEIGSPIAAAVITNVVPLLGLGLGWLLELPLRPGEELVPTFHLRLRSAAWTAATLLGVGWTVVRLLS
jgi:hypothetical protein